MSSEIIRIRMRMAHAPTRAHSTHAHTLKLKRITTVGSEDFSVLGFVEDNN